MSGSTIASPLRSLLLAAGLAVGIASAGPLAASDARAGNGLNVTLRSVTDHAVPSGFGADARLLVHTMPDVRGGQIPATTLLFVPKGTAPTGGWPIVAWAHGTSTPGQKTCAPSLTPALDGGLTRDGFPSDYVFQIAELLKAGYAVVAPDLEGLGAEAIGPYPYFGASSGARSLISAVEAARLAEPHLSNRYAAMGHSDGGHLALGVEAHAGEASGLEFENVGGAVRAAVWPLLNVGARVPVCGLVSGYDGDVDADGSPHDLMMSLIVKRIRMEGFMIGDHYGTGFVNFGQQMSGWVGAGRIHADEDIVDGLENAPEAFVGMLEGRNLGKTLVRIGRR